MEKIGRYYRQVMESTKMLQIGNHIDTGKGQVRVKWIISVDFDHESRKVTVYFEGEQVSGDEHKRVPSGSGAAH